MQLPQNKSCGFHENRTICFVEVARFVLAIILANKPLDTPTSYDSIHYKDDWASYYDSTPVVAQPGDSALKYFYKVLDLHPKGGTLIDLYLPVLQLEQQLRRAHNPLAELPFDTVEGVHFPFTYFIDWPKDGVLDTAVDYYVDASASHSYFWVNFSFTRFNEDARACSL